MCKRHKRTFTEQIWNRTKAKHITPIYLIDFLLTERRKLKNKIKIDIFARSSVSIFVHCLKYADISLQYIQIHRFSVRHIQVLIWWLLNSYVFYWHSVGVGRSTTMRDYFQNFVVLDFFLFRRARCDVFRVGILFEVCVRFVLIFFFTLDLVRSVCECVWWNENCFHMIDRHYGVFSMEFCYFHLSTFTLTFFLFFK